jgi:hypothetical protein
MNDSRLARDRSSDRRYLLDQDSLRPPIRILKNNWFRSLVVCLSFVVSIGMSGQSPSSYVEARIACAQGLGQQAVNRARGQGLQRGVSDLCVVALSWTASNGNLLAMYIGKTGEGGGRLLVNRYTDRAQLSTSPFRADGTPAEMWNKGELTPSLAFDAGFTRSYLGKGIASSASMVPAELKRKTEACLNQSESLAVCADVGSIQGTLAYQTNSAFSNSGAMPSPKTESQGPDRARTAAAIDRKFQIWSQSWSWDRYQPGSVQITNINCAQQCKASGQFSFNRMGSIHTIPFVAFLPSEGDDKYSLGRLCYNDETSGMRECTD